jgi:hypothetical protein
MHGVNAAAWAVRSDGHGQCAGQTGVGEYRCEQVGMGMDRNKEGRGGDVSKRYDEKVDRKRTFWTRKTVMRQRASRGWGKCGHVGSQIRWARAVCRSNRRG